MKNLWRSRLELFVLRVIGFWIDLLVLTPVCAAIAWCLSHVIENPGTLSGQELDAAWWTPLVVFVYRLIVEAIWQTSLGKLLVGLTVTPGNNDWSSATLRNSWLVLTAVISLAGTLGLQGNTLTTVEVLIPSLLGLCILIWSKTPFDVLAKSNVDKAATGLWQDWLTHGEKKI